MAAKKTKLIDRIHTYAGVAVFVILALQAITGVLIVDRERTMQILWSEAYTTTPATGPTATADVLLENTPTTPDQFVTSLFYPERDDAPVMAIIAPNMLVAEQPSPPRIVTLHPETAEVVSNHIVVGNVTLIANLIHEQLLAGAVGQFILLIVGIAFVALTITGVWRWWPGWGKLGSAFSMMRPTKSVSATLWRWHAPLGAVFAVAFLWIGVTGAMIVLRPLADPPLQSMGLAEAFPDIGAIGGSEIAPPPEDTIGVAGAEAIARAEFPNKKLTSLVPLSPISHMYAFVFTDALDRPSLVTISPEGEIIDRYASSEVPAASQTFDLMRPLHAGLFLPEALRSLLYVVGVALLLMSVTGIVINRRKAGMRKKKRKAQKAQAALDKAGAAMRS